MVSPSRISNFSTSVAGFHQLKNLFPSNSSVSSVEESQSGILSLSIKKFEFFHPSDSVSSVEEFQSVALSISIKKFEFFHPSVSISSVQESLSHPIHPQLWQSQQQPQPHLGPCWPLTTCSTWRLPVQVIGLICANLPSSLMALSHL